MVVHCVSLPEGRYGTGAPAQLFQGDLDHHSHPTFADLAGVRVAPHVLIDRVGHLQQFVPFDQSAWHAGVSSWAGRGNCNDYSIGIELEGWVGDPFTDAQYQQLARVVVALLDAYPELSPGAVVGHSDVAPGRKQDPGAHFDWAKCHREIHKLLAGLVDVGVLDVAWVRHVRSLGWSFSALLLAGRG